MSATLTHVALHVRDLAACLAFYRTFCGLKVVHSRGPADRPDAVWLAQEGRESEFIFVLIPDGPGRDQAERDYSHFGFAMDSRDAVDAIAAKARQAGCLLWPPREEPFPVGYYCGLRDPDGNAVEFSYGQPLGPGAGDAAP
ncbi:MAG: VOC family protein [Rhodospirillales bacterium]|nr:MAG: VOC family protein [Rhodospirillales bacterium]